jgi:hypothetical protein
MAFDIDRFAEESTSLHWEDLGLDALREAPLPPETLRTLRYMCDVEFQARARLQDRPKAQKPARLALRTAWQPVGSGVSSRPGALSRTSGPAAPRGGGGPGPCR